jgi:8-oxo-dGTP diphosphatase
MSFVFGENIDNLVYIKRKGVYAVIYNPEKSSFLTVKNEQGHYFLPGGGIEVGESHSDCLEREVVEETGFKAIIGDYIGKAMRYFTSTKNEPMLNDGYFYLMSLSERIQEPMEPDYSIEWVNLLDIKELLFHEHHLWAVEEVSKRMKPK